MNLRIMMILNFLSLQMCKQWRAILLAAIATFNASDAFLQSSPEVHTFRQTRPLSKRDVDIQEKEDIASVNTIEVRQDGSDVLPALEYNEAARRARAQKANDTWSTIALQPTSKNLRRDIPLRDNVTTKVYNQRLFDDFCTIKGTYFMNGLASCKIGDRLVHPFEAHGHCKSLVFDGKGTVYYTSNIVETPIAKKECSQNKVLNRGVMSTVADMDSILGNIQNALSSSERDTANLTADLWPPPSTKNDEGIKPMLLTCTDNGEFYVLDPKTLETKGRLVDVVPKLKSVFPERSKFLAHTRYDEDRNTFIVCRYEMIIPGEDNKGNTHMDFIEFDESFDVVSRREFTTRFIIFHDWAMTENYYVVPKNPAYLQYDGLAKFVFGLGYGTNVFAMEEETNSEFILIPRHDPSEEVHEVESDAFFNLFHFGPVYENEGKSELIVNGCVLNTYTFGGEMGFDGENQRFVPIEWGTTGLSSTGGYSPPPQLEKFVIDVKTFSIKRKERVPVIPVDMPTFIWDAKPCRYSYFLGASRPEGWFPFRQIVKLDLETCESIVHDAGDDKIVSEPMFIPRNHKNPTDDEDNGFVISYVHDAHKSKKAMLMIFDAQSFEDGPIAEVCMGELFPWAVHGSFYPGYNP